MFGSYWPEYDRTQRDHLANLVQRINQVIGKDRIILLGGQYELSEKQRKEWLVMLEEKLGNMFILKEIAGICFVPRYIAKDRNNHIFLIPRNKSSIVDELIDKSIRN